MQRNPEAPRGILFPVVIAFAAGFICGAAAAIYKLSPAPADPHAGHVQQSQINQRDQMDRMAAALAAEVERNPDNFQAWEQLGNLYYDGGAPEKAIESYEKALDLEPNHADILTDLGVMYRRNGRPQAAVDSFDRALAVDPSHETARFNKGVVLLYDLNDAPGAIAAWKSLAEINPVFTAPGGQSLDELIRQHSAKSGME
jgi:cytochrome c-type biogenesis protein CcmH/NrfG